MSDNVGAAVWAPLGRLAARLSHARWFLALGGLIAAACVWQAGLQGVAWGPEASWNDVRLARAYAAAGGADLYASVDEGVLPGHLYGPVGFYLLAPVRLFGTPDSAIRAGIAISVALVMVPFAAALLGAGPRGPAAALLLAAFFHLYWSQAAATLWSVHVDAPAVGLVLVSWIALMRARENETAGAALIVCSAAAACAAWTKQTAASALVLPAALLWLDGRRRDAAQALGWTFACGLGLAALFGGLYGYQDLWFTMFEVPARHARYFGRLLNDSPQLGSLLDLLPLAAVAVFAPPRDERLLRRMHAAALYAAAWLPLAVLGRVKVSGSPNNYLGVDVFLTLAVCLAAAAALESAASDARMRRAAGVVVGILLAVQVARTGVFLAHEAVVRSVRSAPRPSAQAYAYLKAHPGEAYFPWNPLAALMAEGELYHSGYGALTRAQAGLPVGQEQWRAHLPASAQLLICPGPEPKEVLELMPEYDKRVELPELPRWSVLERSTSE